ncbi:unnamed protein product [Cuscuta europaea]|uniref:Uncharacterized protein n=1 Tax=Cuscuta europaea TaxID=41803 RepID=A0A9P0ZEJ4_CUSEU|nr:unnamed protein product [Cuscuta europaea]
MSSASCGSNIKVTLTLDYERAVYCECRLKSPLCVTRGSGSQSFGCQGWKVGAVCGFFAWKEDIKIPKRENHALWVEEVKKQMRDLTGEVIHGCGEVAHLKAVVQSGIEENKNVKCILIAIVVAMCLFLSLLHGKN